MTQIVTAPTGGADPVLVASIQDAGTALCSACAPLGHCCPQERGSEIVASNNAPGAALARYVALPPLDAHILELNLAYLPTNDDRHPEVARLKRNLARLEGVSPRSIRLTGSLLDLFRALPAWLGCNSIYKTAGDFPGYTSLVVGIPTFEIPIDLEAEDVDPDIVAGAVAKATNPLIYLTFPVTNPNQQRMSVDVVHAILDANSRAIVVIDHAYRRYGDTPGLAALAQEHDRVIYVDTAAKDLFLCGARVGWLTAGPALIAKIAPHVAPYVASPVSVAQVNSLLESPETLTRLVATVVEARDILAAAVAGLGLPFRTGAGPWVLVHFGIRAPAVVDQLLAEYRIRVQLQEGALAGWVRVSATVPCQADTIATALRAIAPVLSGQAPDSLIELPGAHGTAGMAQRMAAEPDGAFVGPLPGVPGDLFHCRGSA